MVAHVQGKHAEFTQQLNEGKEKIIEWKQVVKKGASVTKKVLMSDALEEEQRWSNKALNVIIRGLVMGDTPMVDAKALFTKMGINFTFETAWRVGKDDALMSPMVIKFRTVTDRSTFMSMRATLKGIKICFDDDLTLSQHEHQREGMSRVMVLREEGKWAIYRDGKVIICERVERRRESWRPHDSVRTMG